jgi:recombinational DNA repair protein RecT
MTTQTTQMTPARQLYVAARDRARQVLVARVGEERAEQAAAEIAHAIALVASTSSESGAIFNCSQQSILDVVQQTAIDGLRLTGAYPEAYLVPRGGQLTRPISPRGLARLARRGGLVLRTVLVGQEDHLVESFGVAVEHEQIGARPTNLADLRAVIVVAREQGTGHEDRYVIAGETLRERAKAKGAGPVWRSWPLEMAQKSAVSYCFARGWIMPPDELRAVLEAESVAVQATPEPVSAPRRGKAALLAPPPVVEPEDDREPERVPVASDGHQLGD